MSIDRSGDLKLRVIVALRDALSRQGFVSPIDALVGARLLPEVHVTSWKKGRIDVLETMVQGSPQKIASVMETFGQWVKERGLKPTEVLYQRRARTGVVELRFTVGGNPRSESFFRTHYVSPALPERKQQQIAEKLNRPPQPVVFSIVRDSQCSECGAELGKGRSLFMDGDQALCLPCAGMDDLEYLPAGDTALTRRASKYSERSAVVVRFSRSRNRYERQGLLLEAGAIEKAEHECTADADERARARAAAAEQRKVQDRKLVADMTAEIRALFPGCPSREASAIAAYTAVRGSGRVGRSAAGRDLDEGALIAAVTAAIRHRHTNYDALLAEGVERSSARQHVFDHVQEVLASWRE